MNTFIAFIVQLLSFFHPVEPKLPISPVTTLPHSTVFPSPPPSPSPTHTLIPTNTLTPKLLPVNNLLTAVNNFRKANGKSSLSSHPVLCSIANERINALIIRGSLDNHEGYLSYADTLRISFSQWWETLFFASPPKKSTDIVFTHWANSPGHKDSLLSSATHGCGAEKNGFAVFELGRKR
jgi:uncharacterized protein YkwD